MNLREGASGETCAGCVTATGHREPYVGIFLRNCIRGPSPNMVLLLASFFSILVLPYWFHRLINVQHQKFVSLIMVRKDLKNSGICVSEQRLYQLAPASHCFLKKENAPDFWKGPHHACIHLMTTGVCPNSQLPPSQNPISHLHDVWQQRDKYKN